MRSDIPPPQILVELRIDSDSGRLSRANDLRHGGDDQDDRQQH
jgi:hypothetical protein